MSLIPRISYTFELIGGENSLSPSCLKALGYTAKDLLYHFYETEMIEIGETGAWREAIPEILAQGRVTKDIVGGDDGNPRQERA